MHHNEFNPEASSRRSADRGTFLAKACLCAVAALTAPAALTVVPTTAAAQSADDSYNGGKARVSRSASLRSLTEAVAAASCRVGNGYDTAEAQADLARARDDFDRIIDGLINGSPALGMPGAEPRARTREALNVIGTFWSPIHDAAGRLADGSGSAADAATVADTHADLFEQTEQTASVISGQYADPQQLLQSDATVLNFAVRQRALAYRMSRLMCEMASGTGDASTQQALAETVDLFEKTLLALRDGFPGAGINPPPNETIANSLNSTFELWRDRRSAFDGAIAGQTPDAAQVSAAAALSDDLSKAMNNAITLYLIATPGQDGVYRVPLEAYARDQLSTWLSDPALIAAITAQNERHAALTEDEVIALDQQWRAEAGAGGGPLIESLLSSAESQWLRDQQTATAGFVTEVFVMDDKGLNVAQSVETSDYWQGDEAKWQQTYLVGPDALHISEVEFDDSTGFYQSQASLPITDPATGAVIGAVTFGINVQSLM